MKKLFVLAGLVSVAVFASAMRTAAHPIEGGRLEYDPTEETWYLTWQGKSGRTYFIQHSEDLMSWNWMPVVESGQDAVIEWGLTTSADRFFLRLQYTDQPTADPEGGDFDGDGLTNLWEVENGLNPLNADTDGDGMSDGWEVANGLDALVDDAYLDPDDDGLANLAEHAGQYDPQVADTDGDGLMDGWGRGDFVFGQSGWLEGAGEAAYGYDAAGNLTNAGGTP